MVGCWLVYAKNLFIVERRVFSCVSIISGWFQGWFAWSCVMCFALTFLKRERGYLFCFPVVRYWCPLCNQCESKTSNCMVIYATLALALGSDWKYLCSALNSFNSVLITLIHGKKPRKDFNTCPNDLSLVSRSRLLTSHYSLYSFSFPMSTLVLGVPYVLHQLKITVSLYHIQSLSNQFSCLLHKYCSKLFTSNYFTLSHWRELFHVLSSNYSVEYSEPQ